MANDPITREEMFLNAVATGVSSGIEPITREEKYLAYIGGQDVIPPEPITRKEYFFSMISPGGGSGVTIKNQNKTVTENGTYKADSGYTGLGTVTVTVPQEEPVVEPLEVTENGTYNPPAGVDGYAPVTVNVEAVGGGNDIIAYLNNTLEEVISDEVTNVRYYTFLDKTAIRKVSLPNCTTIGAQGFKKCTGLEEVYLDKFTGGKHGSAGEIFANCDSLHTVYVPEIDTIPPSFLRYCGRLKNFIFGSKLGWVTDYCLSETAIEQFIAPSVVYLTNGVFYGCRSLERVDVTMSQTNCNLGNVVFQNCEKLTSLIIRATNHTVPLSNVSAFDGTPFASGGTGGTVYVPSELISEYQQATNWSTLYAAGSLTFAAIEGSEYE